jgi:hypothetical protein
MPLAGEEELLSDRGTYDVVELVVAVDNGASIAWCIVPHEIHYLVVLFMRAS